MCQSEIGDLVELADEFADQGVVFIEVQQAADSQAILIDWVGEHRYYGLRTDPASRMMTDFRKTELFSGMAVLAMVDWRTMRVIDNQCGSGVADARACIEKWL